MTEVLYPVFYGSTYWPLERMQDRFNPHLHPEFARRWWPMMVAAEGLVGIGGGYRTHEEQAANHARDPRQFAKPGNSFHELQPWPSGEWYQAFDTIGNDIDGDGAREGYEHLTAWNWIRDHGLRYGVAILHHIPHERHHAQGVILHPRTGAQLNSVADWRTAGCPDLDPTFKLPGQIDQPEGDFNMKPRRGRLWSPVSAGYFRITPEVDHVIQLGLNETSALLNVVATNTAGPGWLAVWGSGAWQGDSNLNWNARGASVANLVYTPIALGTVKVRSNVELDIVIDLAGA